ncbi:uncharacterized protein LOC27207572 isoform X3 [Drosophila simulans]|uniref:Uncharacterized protein, isoform C n=1 Tax=Drosophila simulans TaxID=7240 RepID=A0A0J9RH22_DROSI|nr:uncharacterized protein LOC27207572 isoform X3 [Drosophila simulans]KMY95211.1 uncharacterized protein Dsimw501_GD27723, isoform C [Drosophila simulans]
MYSQSKCTRTAPQPPRYVIGAHARTADRGSRIGDDGRSLAEITPNSCLWLEEAGGHSLTHSSS